MSGATTGRDAPVLPEDQRAAAGRSHGTDRVVAVANLKTLMVAWIIFGHALLGYTVIGGWPYDEVQEVTMAPATELVVTVVMGPSALFVIGAFFFLAGLFAPHELARHGRRGFVRIKLLRLGLPWVTTMLLVWPLCMWLALRSAGHPVTFGQAFRARRPFLDSGQLWFVEILLYVSLGYCLWAGRGRSGSRSGEVGGRTLVAVAGLIALASFAVRLQFPARSQQVLDLHVWQWPQCVGMFCLGTVVAHRGWARQVPPRVRRQARAGVVVALAVLPLVALAAGISSVARDGQAFLGGWRVQAFVLDVVEAGLVVSGTLWLLAAAQRRLTSTSPLWTGAARAAYAAFVLQGPVLIGLAVALRPLALAGGVKALLVATFGVLASFLLAWLVTRTPVGRVV